MKNTAKISLLIALALCITIGGVYASWTYYNQTFNTAAEAASPNFKPTITSATIVDGNVSRGAISVTGAPTLTIDQATGSYKGVLNWGNSVYTVKYTPATNNNNVSGSATPAQTININCVITITTSQQSPAYDIANVFVIAAEIPQLTSVGTGGATFDMADYLTINPIFELPTYTDYQNFANFISTVTITVTFSDATTGS